MPVKEQPAINMAGLLVLNQRVWETQVMTSLAEAKSKFGHVVRDAGGVIFKVERGPSVGSSQEEKLQIGTPDGFVKGRSSKPPQTSMRFWVNEPLPLSNVRRNLGSFHV